MSKKAIILAILLVALAARAAFLFTGGRLNAPLEFDEVQYDIYARNMVAGHGYTYDGVKPTSFWPPGYPVFLASVYAVSGCSPAAARVVQCLLDVASVALVFGIARRYFGDRAAIVAAGICAVYPYFIYRSVHVLVETPAMFLALLMVYLATLARERGAWRYWLLAGGVAGVLALTKAAFQVMPLIFAAWFIIAFAHRKTYVLRLAACIGVMALVITPYVIRNAQIQGKFVGVATEGGTTFYGAHNELTFSEPEFIGFWANPLRLGEEEPLVAGPREAEISDREYRKGWEAIKANADKMPAHMLNKLSNFWFIHFYYLEHEGMAEKILRIIFAGLMPFFLIGLFAAKRGTLRPVMPQLLFGMFTVIALVYYGNARQRAPIEPLVLMFAVSGMAAVARGIVGRARAKYKNGRKACLTMAEDMQADATGRTLFTERRTPRPVGADQLVE